MLNHTSFGKVVLEQFVIHHKFFCKNLEHYFVAPYVFFNYLLI